MIWNDLQRLQDYRLAPKTPGLYVIGTWLPDAEEIFGDGDSDPYLGKNFPHHLQRMYVGRSDISVRSRLSAHCRGRGNKGIHQHKKDGTALFFTVAEGDEASQMEVYWLSAFSPAFSCNIRDERERSAKEMARNIRSKMKPEELDFYDNLPPPDEHM